MKFVHLINLKLLTILNSFLLKIAEHENFSANKYENANNREIFMLSSVEHEKSFIISEPGPLRLLGLYIIYENREPLKTVRGISDVIFQYSVLLMIKLAQFTELIYYNSDPLRLLGSYEAASGA